MTLSEMQAIEVLEQLERIDDDFAPLYLKRGECHSMIGKR